MPNIVQTYSRQVAASIDDCEYTSGAVTAWTTNGATIRIGSIASPATTYEGWFRFTVGTGVPFGSVITSVTLRATFNSPSAQTHTIATAIGDAAPVSWLSYPSGMTFYGTTTNWSVSAGSGAVLRTSGNIAAATTWMNARPFPLDTTRQIAFKVYGGTGPNQITAYDSSVLSSALLTVSYYPVWLPRRAWMMRCTRSGWSRPAHQRLRQRHDHERHLILPD